MIRLSFYLLPFSIAGSISNILVLFRLNHLNRITLDHPLHYSFIFTFRKTIISIIPNEIVKKIESWFGSSKCSQVAWLRYDNIRFLFLLSTQRWQCLYETSHSTDKFGVARTADYKSNFFSTAHNVIRYRNENYDSNDSTEQFTSKIFNFSFTRCHLIAQRKQNTQQTTAFSICHTTTEMCLVWCAIQFGVWTVSNSKQREWKQTKEQGKTRNVRTRKRDDRITLYRCARGIKRECACSGFDTYKSVWTMDLAICMDEYSSICATV